MTNKASRKVPDTRGRPRSPDTEDWADQIEEAYLQNNLPLEVWVKKGLHHAKRLRNSFAFKEVQEELGVRLRVLPFQDGAGFMVCERRES